MLKVIKSIELSIYLDEEQKATLSRARDILSDTLAVFQKNDIDFIEADCCGEVSDDDLQSGIDVLSDLCESAYLTCSAEIESRK